MRQLLKTFFKTPDTNPYPVLACLLLAGVLELAGISALLPAVTAVSGGDTAESSPFNETVRRLISGVGIEPSFANLLVIVSLLLVLRSAMSFAALTYAGVATARVAAGLRNRLILALMKARWSFYTDQSGGKIANAVSNDATRAANAYFYVARSIAFGVQVVFYAVAALLVDWRIALLGLIVGAAIATFMTILIRAAKRAGYKQTDRTADITTLEVDVLANIKPLKAMHRYGHIGETFASTLKRLKRALVNMEMARQGLVHGGDALIVIVVAIGTYVIHAMWRTPMAELFVSGVIFFQIMSLASKMQRYYQEVSLFEAAYVRIEELAQSAREAQEGNSGSAAPDIDSGCRFKDVEFAHSDMPVIRNADLFIPARQITILQGPSGSGKTTIIDLLIGLHSPDRGDILIGSDSIKDIDIVAWRRMIGYVPQELTLLHASIRENIRLSDPSIGDGDIMDAMRQAGAAEFVSQLASGLDTNVGEMGGKLSGGQRQRISLARALVSQPEVLILDEVTSALDPDTESGIIANIAALRGRYTIIAITHRPGWTRIADRLYKVNRGKVAEVAIGKARSTTNV
jgi:ATP-binding cassette subfamily C protein